MGAPPRGTDLRHEEDPTAAAGTLGFAFHRGMAVVELRGDKGARPEGVRGPLPPGGPQGHHGRSLRGGLRARQGVRIYKALMDASPVPWGRLRVVLDHGCGNGRVARLFKDQGKDLQAVDIDRGFIGWMREA